MQRRQCLVIILLIILTTNLPAVADVVEDAKAIDISGGENHTLVLTANKWPWACGDNYSYQLGIGDTTDPQKTLVRVHGPNDVNYLENINDIDAGWTHSLALDVNSFVWAWGANYYGQLGDNQKSGDQSATPVQVLSGEQDPGDPNSYLKYIESISAGRSGQHSLAVDANNFVWAWGYNQFGQLGIGIDHSNKLTPVQVLSGEQDPNDLNSPLENIIAVSAGEEHSMALDANGFVWTWGDNKWTSYEPPYTRYGKLGNGSEVDFKDTPVQVLSGRQEPNDPNSYLKNIVAISAGWDHCMALEKHDPCDPNCNGRVYTWGRNGQTLYRHGGQLGDGTTEDSNAPVIVLSGEQEPNDPNSFLKDIIDISAGESHSLALDVNGFVWAWGDNTDGQLGNDSNDPCTTPVRVVGLNGEGYLKNIIDISAGFWHSLAIDANGTIWTWGKGEDGRLGLGNITNRNTPHPIPVVYNFTQQIFYFKIQDAIDDANNGDVIVSSQGTYYENIDFLDKSITVKSTDPDNWNVTDRTTIDGSNNDSNYVSIFDDNSGSTLAGFTITNGNYGGIYCGNQSSPNITNCRIQNNTGEYGFGIVLDYSSPNITNCNILNNGDYGIYCWDNSDPNIINCTIEDNGNDGINCCNSDPNIINCIIKGNDPNGICCDESSPTISNCVIIENGNEYSYGGGICCTNSSSPTITNCIFSGNLASNGGGICNVSSDPNITNSIFTGNIAVYYGGGMANVQSSPSVRNCIFSGNSAQWGGGMQNWQSSPTVNNCTFSGNFAYVYDSIGGYGGGMHNDANSDPNVTNCIFWDNNAVTDGNDIYNYGDSDPNVTYSDVKEGYEGTGNIDEDPCFMDVNTPTGSWTANPSYDSSTYQSTLTDANASWSVNELAAKFIKPDTSQYLQFLIVSNDTNTITVWSDVNSIVEAYDTYEIFDYHLGPDSPCIDAGDPNFDYDPNETDIDGEPRVVNGRVDMGADEYYESHADFNYDDIVNFIDYALFAYAWQTDNPDFSLDDDNDVDMNDLALFAKDWLWQAGWAKTFAAGRSQTMSQGFLLMEALYQSAPAEQTTEIKPLDIEYIIKWLEEIWLIDEELRKIVSEEQWLKFMESIKEGC